MEESYNRPYSISNILKSGWEYIKPVNFSNPKYKARIARVKKEMKKSRESSKTDWNALEKIIFNI